VVWLQFLNDNNFYLYYYGNIISSKNENPAQGLAELWILCIDGGHVKIKGEIK